MKALGPWDVIVFVLLLLPVVLLMDRIAKALEVIAGLR